MAVIVDQCVEIDLFDARSSDQASRRNPAEIAIETQLPCTGPEVNDAERRRSAMKESAPSWPSESA